MTSTDAKWRGFVAERWEDLERRAREARSLGKAMRLLEEAERYRIADRIAGDWWMPRRQKH